MQCLHVVLDKGGCLDGLCCSFFVGEGGGEWVGGE